MLGLKPSIWWLTKSASFHLWLWLGVLHWVLYIWLGDDEREHGENIFNTLLSSVPWLLMIHSTCLPWGKAAHMAQPRWREVECPERRNGFDEHVTVLFYNFQALTLKVLETGKGGIQNENRNLSFIFFFTCSSLDLKWGSCCNFRWIWKICLYMGLAILSSNLRL